MTTQGAKSMRYGTAVEAARHQGDAKLQGQGPVRVSTAATSVAKRAMDIVLALAAIIFAFPLLIALALLVKLTDGGPILYGHRRAGRGGKEFVCYKLRTMRTDAAQRLADLLARDPVAAAEWAQYRKLRHDPRVTPLGRLLRRSSLDELPQLLNILAGDMSVIGPRPITAEETQFYGDDSVFYSAVRPGVLGLWQVNGRNLLSYDERIDFDVQYVSQWSMWLDIKILFLAVPVVLFGKGAY